MCLHLQVYQADSQVFNYVLGKQRKKAASMFCIMSAAAAAAAAANLDALKCSMDVTL
jgi:hypothetical protein